MIKVTTGISKISRFIEREHYSMSSNLIE